MATKSRPSGAVASAEIGLIECATPTARNPAVASMARPARGMAASTSTTPIASAIRLPWLSDTIRYSGDHGRERLHAREVRAGVRADEGQYPGDRVLHVDDLPGVVRLAGREVDLHAFLLPVGHADRAGPDPLANQQHRRPGVVVLAVVAVQLRRAAELGAVDDGRLVEEAGGTQARLCGEAGQELVEEREELFPARVLLGVVAVGVEPADVAQRDARRHAGAEGAAERGRELSAVVGILGQRGGQAHELLAALVRVAELIEPRAERARRVQRALPLECLLDVGLPERRDREMLDVRVDPVRDAVVRQRIAELVA